MLGQSQLTPRAQHQLVVPNAVPSPAAERQLAAVGVDALHAAPDVGDVQRAEHGAQRDARTAKIRLVQPGTDHESLIRADHCDRHRVLGPPGL